VDGEEHQTIRPQVGDTTPQAKSGSSEREEEAVGQEDAGDAGLVFILDKCGAGDYCANANRDEGRPGELGMEVHLEQFHWRPNTGGKACQGT
jgi:hypothetical protein